VTALFQEDVLKLLGNILEELYGPLNNSRTVSDTVHSTCTVSELSSVDVAGNSAGSCLLLNSSLQLCEPTATNVTDISTVTQESPADVDVSDVQSLNVCDVNIPPLVANSFILSKPSDLMSDVDSHQSDVAKAWSAGTLITDSSGKSVQVNAGLFIFVFLFMVTLSLLLCFIMY